MQNLAIGGVMTKAAIVTQSTLTDRFQTTVPATVRQALQLSKRDKLEFTVLDNGTVMLSRAENTEADPVLAQFLNFLQQDMVQTPSNIQPLSAQEKQQVDTLVADVEIDLDTALAEEDD